MRKIYTTLCFFAPIYFVSVFCYSAQTSDYIFETIAEGLDKPYAFAFLPNGDILITERPNRLRVVRQGLLSSIPIKGVQDVLVEGPYSGLLDIALHPQFKRNNFIYLSFTYGNKDANATRVVRTRYVNNQLEDMTEIFTAFPMKDTLNHAGGHLAFLKDNTLLITIGEGYEYREKAQDLESMLGKIVRVTDEGKIPQSNPFLDRNDLPSPVWSYGHRNPQGIIYDVITNTVYEHEHGPQGGDEINLILPGNNYGWPLVTHGLDYTGAYVTPFQGYPGTEPPLVHWTPSLAPSGITQCRNCQWTEWEGDFFIGMLATQHVRRVRIDNGIAISQEVLFKEIGERIRNLRFGPDGFLYVLTESENSRLIKITPNR